MGGKKEVIRGKYIQTKEKCLQNLNSKIRNQESEKMAIVLTFDLTQDGTFIKACSATGWPMFNILIYQKNGTAIKV